MKKITTILFTLTMLQVCLGQGIGIGTDAPDPSAAVEISSTTKGILVPRLSSTQRNMIASPAQGLLVFDITTNSFWFRNSSSWVELVDSVSTEVHRNGSDMIYMGMTDRVGIGTNNPTHKLQVKTGNEAYGISHTNGEVDIATYTSSSSGGWIGTKSNHPFYLFSNDGFFQFTLLPNGNVGIGTGNPITTLHVNGNSLFNGLLGIGTSLPDQSLSVHNKFGVDANGAIHVKNTPRQFYFYEDALPSKMILSHSPSYPTWGLQYTNSNSFRFLKDSTAVMSVNLGDNNVEVNGNLKIGHQVVVSDGVNIPGLSAGSAVCNCPGGTVVTGGGFWVNYSNYVEITSSFPNTTSSWKANMNNPGLETKTLYVYAICARLAN